MGICHIVRCKAALPEYKQEANNMATIEKTVESVGMKITVNYVGTAKAITGMQEPIREKQVKVTAEAMVEVA